VGLRAEDIVEQHAAMGIGLGVVTQRATGGGDFEQLLPHMYMHDLEAATDDARAAEAVAHLLRRRIGGDGVILGVVADDQVAHRTADNEGLVAVLLHGIVDAAAAAADAVAVDAVGAHGNDGRLAIGTGGLFATKNAGNELADLRLSRFS